MRSWQKRAVALLAAILVAVGIFFGWTSYDYSTAVHKRILEENTTALRLWSNMLETRTAAMMEHIIELALTIYNKTELRAGTPPMDIHTRTDLIKLMGDLRLTGTDADAFFVLDTEGGEFLFSARQSLAVSTIMDLKQDIRRGAEDWATPLRNRNWAVRTTGETDYLFKGVRLGKYVVGAASLNSHYSLSSSFSLLGDAAVCCVQTAEGVFCFDGDAAAWDMAAPGDGTSGRGSRRLTVARDVPVLEGRAYVIAAPTSMLGGREPVTVLLLADSAACILLVVLLYIILRRDAVRPTMELVKANGALASGQIDYRLDPDSAGSSEFRTLFESFNSMADQLVRLRIDAYDMQLRDEKNRLAMLRAQIKPHSLLNVINTINNMTYTSAPEDIRAYIAAFAKFVRYMLNTSTDWSTVREELDHAENYLKMQQTRFPDSIRYTVDCDEAAAGRSVPFLLLFTLVENTAKHAMTLYEPLEVHISCRVREEAEGRFLYLAVEDSGAGFSREALERLKEETQSLYAKEHLGLNNVRYTLNLLYHRSDLLQVSNRPEGGARVEVRIPEEDTP